MQGLMQDWPLLIPTILDHAARVHARGEIVTRSVEGPIHRTNYAELRVRALKLAKALTKLGVKPGDRIGTAGWNTYRHMETWYGIVGTGAIYHTINPRLFADQIAYIINHAEDSYFFLDVTFVPQFEELQERLRSVRGFVVMADRAHMPATRLRNVLCYEELLAEVDDDFQWTEVEENAAAGLCYTSGTTGNPKGVLYSHRSNVLHAMASNNPNALGASSSDTILPIAPMYHANSWGLVFSVPMQGAKLVMPGCKMDGPSICDLLQTEKVTFAAAVPTVWLMLLQYLQSENKTLPHLKRVVIGGSACPRFMMETFEQTYGVKVGHLWGMTEMSPVGTTSSLKGNMLDWPYEKQLDIKLKQGFPIYSVEAEIFDDEGRTMPHDGKAFGRLKVRGPAVSSEYFRGEGGKVLDSEGWFDTGDVATFDGDGFIQITDRAKDVVKSGGEWISSIEIENLAVGHPEIAEAAVIGVYHPKWDERPLLICVRKAQGAVTREGMLKFLEGKIAKWWMPDDVVFVQEIPHTATGKILKTALREQFKAHVLPSAR